jgi:hypothetical protein
MGKASRRRRREDERVLRDVGVVYWEGPDGEEVVIEGEAGEALRELMCQACPICAAGGPRQG